MKRMNSFINTVDMVSMIIDAVIVVIAILLLFLSDSDIWLRCTILFLSLNVWIGDIRLTIEKSRTKAEGNDNDNDT